MPARLRTREELLSLPEWTGWQRIVTPVTQAGKAPKPRIPVRRSFTEAEDATIRQMLAAGNSMDRTAKTMRRCYNLVKARAEELGVAQRKVPHKQGEFSKAEIATMLACVEAGESHAHIAAKLGRSVGSVSKRLWKLGK